MQIAQQIEQSALADSAWARDQHRRVVREAFQDEVGLLVPFLLWRRIPKSIRSITSIIIIHR